MAYKKPNDYDNVRVGGFKILPAGGYICKILKAEETTSKTGKPMVKVAFDICDGDFAGYFKEMFEGRKAAAESPQDVKWPFNGTKWILLYDNEGKTNRDFKGFCKALEDSGTEVWINDTFEASRLKNAKVGIVFRREEQEYMNQTSWRTVPFRFRSIKAIEDGNFTVPEDKYLPNSLTDTGFEADSFSAAEDDIPF